MFPLFPLKPRSLLKVVKPRRAPHRLHRRRQHHLLVWPPHLLEALRALAHRRRMHRKAHHVRRHCSVLLRLLEVVELRESLRFRRHLVRHRRVSSVVWRHSERLHRVVEAELALLEVHLANGVGDRHVGAKLLLLLLACVLRAVRRLAQVHLLRRLLGERIARLRLEAHPAESHLFVERRVGPHFARVVHRLHVGEAHRRLVQLHEGLLGRVAGRKLRRHGLQ